MKILPIHTSLNKSDQQYKVMYWSPSSQQWDYFHLAPDTFNNNMVREVITLAPAVANIFRETNMRKT